VTPEKTIVSGGGSNSDLYMQIFADMYGVKTVRNEINGAASLGAAMCAAVASGVYKDFDEAVGHMIKQKDEFLPNMENHKIYQKLNNQAYRDLPKMLESTLKSVFEGLK
ncbi:MAG: sugar kinase, partial [Erysipelotrichaceae bacterium]|nr:sugar kinase [Erysipelotrichaceae bacterium]